MRNLGYYLHLPMLSINETVHENVVPSEHLL